MYPRADKRRLYQIIEMYLAGKLDEKSFSDEFYLTYDLGIDDSCLKEEENKAFHDLSKVTGRFTEYEDDYKKYSSFLFSKKEIKQKILEIKGRLREEFTELGESGELDWETPENGERTNLY